MSDPFVGSLMFVRIYAGKLTAGSYVLNANKGKKERIDRLLEMHANSREDIKVALAGDIVALVVKTKADVDRMAAGLIKLVHEGPSFHFSRDEEVEANVGAPQVNYARVFPRFQNSSMSTRNSLVDRDNLQILPCALSPWRLVVVVSARAKSREVQYPKEYVPGVMKELEECMSKAILAGLPIIDVHAVLVDGSCHDVDSSVLAFQLAARGAFRVEMRKAGPKLLERAMKIEVVTPEEHLGDVISDLNSRRGQINSSGDKPGGLKL
ncbi:hypothetical protein Ancab_032502 [Ancistrocladus abbreviatus]